MKEVIRKNIKKKADSILIKNRIMKEAKENKVTTYAIDFDGTIVENKFPEIGSIKKETVDLMKKIKKSNNNKVIIWTCRTGDYLDKAINFLKENNIPFDEVNNNSAFSLAGPKIYADYYIDDKAVNVKDIKDVKV